MKISKTLRTIRIICTLCLFSLILPVVIFHSDSYGDQYFEDSETLPSITLNREENLFIAQATTFKVLITDNQAPISYVIDGEVQGFVPKYMDVLSKISGLKFEYIICDNYDEMLTRFQNGEGDICAQIHDSQSITSISSVNSFMSYYTLDYGILYMSKTKANIKRVAVEYSDDYIRQIVESQNKDALLYKTPEECANAVLYGNTDAAILSNVIYNELAHHYKYQDLAFSLQTGIKENLYVATSEHTSPYLSSILYKTVSSVNTYKIDQLMFESASSHQKYTLNDLIHQYLALILVLFIFFVITLFFSIWFFKQKRYNIKLEKANKEIIQANSVTNAFFSNLSHDMRTPLAGILGYIDIALNEKDPKTKQEYLKKTKRSGELLLNLVNDTLELSKIRSGKVELSPESINSQELFDSILIPIEAASYQKNINLWCNYSIPDNEFILIDKLKLQDIIMNLLSNAVKYTRAGGDIWFTVKKESDTENNIFYIITVKDNGIGMSPEFLTKVFEPFEQENDVSAGDAPGTGLGMAIVVKLLEILNGSISVSSEKGSGTIFTVKLPVEIADYNHNAISDIPAADDYSHLNGIHLIMCEDNPVNTEIITRMLNSKGISVTHAFNGNEGLKIFEESKENQFKAILMDLRMPVMDGHTATRKIRSLPRADAKTIPIIAMSADAYEDDINKSVKSGMNAHISKPVSPDLLFKTLIHLLRD